MYYVVRTFDTLVFTVHACNTVVASIKALTLSVGLIVPQTSTIFSILYLASQFQTSHDSEIQCM